MKFVGIDGCPEGWMGFSIDHNFQWSYDVSQSISSIVDNLPADLYFVDMPIGLNKTSARRLCDVELRSLLPLKLKSSVFSPPVQATLESKSYAVACATNESVTGKKISIQTWHIMPKIKEFDDYLRDHSAMRDKFLESHPETCFSFNPT